MSSGVSVVIPTKSNVAGLMDVMGDVLADGSVRSVCVVIDGDTANRTLPALPVAVHRLVVPLGSGIQHMWNRGLEMAVPDTHVMLLNDDVRLEADCLGSLARSLDADPTIGLICPTYAEVALPADRDVFDTCRSHYDGTGGMAGFAMMLHHPNHEPSGGDLGLGPVSTPRQRHHPFGSTHGFRPLGRAGSGVLRRQVVPLTTHIVPVQGLFLPLVGHSFVKL